MKMSNVEALKLLQGRVGTKVGNGMCGSLASQMLEYVAGYSFDGEEPGANDDNSIEPFAPGVDMTSSWSVYTTTRWSEIGYTYINNPANSALRAGDIFFVSPARSGIWSGHSGIVLSNVNGIVTTLEQNVDANGDGVGEPWIHQFTSNSGQGSIAWFGGVDGIVRKKEMPNPPSNNSRYNSNKPNNKGDLDMPLLLKTNKKYCPNCKKTHEEAWWVTNGVEFRHIGTQRELKFAQACYPRAKQDLWEYEIEDAIRRSGAIYRKK